MGILITTESLKQNNACKDSYAFITGSLFTKNNPWYSGSNYEAYFEEGIVYNFTCSKSNEVSWLLTYIENHKLNITASLYNKETNTSQYYHNIAIISGSK